MNKQPLRLCFLNSLTLFKWFIRFKNLTVDFPGHNYRIFFLVLFMKQFVCDSGHWFSNFEFFLSRYEAIPHCCFSAEAKKSVSTMEAETSNHCTTLFCARRKTNCKNRRKSPLLPGLLYRVGEQQIMWMLLGFRQWLFRKPNVLNMWRHLFVS